LLPHSAHPDIDLAGRTLLVLAGGFLLPALTDATLPSGDPFRSLHSSLLQSLYTIGDGAVEIQEGWDETFLEFCGRKRGQASPSALLPAGETHESQDA
jgi:hypothetical protein